MTQHQLIIEYIKEFKQITPAKMYGSIYKGEMFGSETSKRARELRKKGILESRQDGKFEVFWLKENKADVTRKLDKIEIEMLDEDLDDLEKKYGGANAWNNAHIIKDIREARKSSDEYRKQGVIRKYS